MIAIYKTGNTSILDGSSGNKLQSYMDEHEISRMELERRTGITLKTISSICEGERYGNLATWIAIARALGCEGLDDIVEV